MQDLFADALHQLLVGKCALQVVRQIEAGASHAGLWRDLEESGLADAMVSEAHGGAGLGLADAYPMLELCGAHAVPVPLAETMLARALIDNAGLIRPEGSITFGPAAADLGGKIVCPSVPCGRVADWALITSGGECLLLPVAQAAVSPAVFPLDATLEWAAEKCETAQRFPSGDDLRTLQACVYAAQLAGALMQIFTRTLEYANERSQFGRPIGKFQAIQHQLSVISEHAFAARMAAQIGCQSLHGTPDRLRVAVAKARSSEAALEVAALSHSIHGAIGFTEEFDLQVFTRRLHAWRQTAGAESYWHGVLGEALVECHDGLALDVIRNATEIH